MGGCRAVGNLPGDPLLKTELREAKGRPCRFAWCEPSADEASDKQRDIVVVLDGERIFGYLRGALASGTVDPEALPCMIGIDAENRFDDYSPWPHAPFRKDAPPFGGGAEAFLHEVLIPVAESVAHDPEIGGEGFARHARVGALSLFGYSLAGLMALYALARTDCFQRYLLASPSCWYPGFTEYFIDHMRPTDARVLIACGEDEGKAHPEPLSRARQETDRIVEVLMSGAVSSVELCHDNCDHHRGVALRASLLLTRA